MSEGHDAEGRPAAGGPDALAARIKANLDQAEANLDQVSWDAVTANLERVKSAPWRVIRNRRLLAESRRLANRNHELLCANDRLFAENAVMLRMRQVNGGLGQDPR